MLFFDIETQTNKKALEFMPDPTPPKNYKKQESIDRYIEEEKAKQISRAALDSDYGKIVAIGGKNDDNEIFSLLSSEGQGEEPII